MDECLRWHHRRSVYRLALIRAGQEFLTNTIYSPQDAYPGWGLGNTDYHRCVLFLAANRGCGWVGHHHPWSVSPVCHSGCPGLGQHSAHSLYLAASSWASHHDRCHLLAIAKGMNGWPWQRPLPSSNTGSSLRSTHPRIQQDLNSPLLISTSRTSINNHLFIRRWNMSRIELSQQRIIEKHCNMPFASMDGLSADPA